MTRGIQSVGVATAVKHFAVNSTEYSRLASNSVISARAMREIYLKAFEMVIKEADPWSIMTSYTSSTAQGRGTGTHDERYCTRRMGL